MHGLAGIRSTSAGVNTRCRFVNKFSVSAVWGPQPLCYGSVRRGAIVGASHGESSRQETSAKPYTNRLQTNPAYQRLKARKQQPQEAGTSRNRCFCMQGPVHLVQYCERGREILLLQDLLHRMTKAQKPPATSRLVLVPWPRVPDLHQVLVTDNGTDQYGSYLVILAKRQAISPHLNSDRPSLMQHQQHRLRHLCKILRKGPGHPCNPSQLCSRSHMHRQNQMHQCGMLILLRASRAQTQWPLCSFG